MKQLAIALALVSSVGYAAFAQPIRVSLYIQPSDDGFQVYLAAAMLKKGGPR